MSDVAAETRYVQIVLHNDYDDHRGTPEEFVVELLHSVFGMPLTEAHKYTAMAARYGEAICADRTIAAARQKEMKASIAVEAISTR